VHDGLLLAKNVVVQINTRQLPARTWHCDHSEKHADRSLCGADRAPFTSLRRDFAGFAACRIGARHVGSLASRSGICRTPM
jgi:hypothetical protein